MSKSCFLEIRLSEKKKLKSSWVIPRAFPRGEHRPGFLPVRLMMLMVVMQQAFHGSSSYDCLDLFSGRCAVSKAFVAKGYKSCALDIELDARDVTWPCCCYNLSI